MLCNNDRYFDLFALFRRDLPNLQTLSVAQPDTAVFCLECLLFQICVDRRGRIERNPDRRQPICRRCDDFKREPYKHTVLCVIFGTDIVPTKIIWVIIQVFAAGKHSLAQQSGILNASQTQLFRIIFDTKTHCNYTGVSGD